MVAEVIELALLRVELDDVGHLRVNTLDVIAFLKGIDHDLPVAFQFLAHVHADGNHLLNAVGREIIRHVLPDVLGKRPGRSEEQTSDLQSLMLISYAVLCLNKQHNYNTPEES